MGGGQRGGVLTENGDGQKVVKKDIQTELENILQLIKFAGTFSPKDVKQWAMWKIILGKKCIH